MRTTVVLCTYNQPEWLEKVLFGYARQSDEDFSLIVADDGSEPPTGQVIERWKRRLEGRLQHVWHDDRGFRKSVILNRAIEAAVGGEAEYLIFSDADCIPLPGFVACHRRMARPGHFLSGGYEKLPDSTSAAIGGEEIESGQAFDSRWLRQAGHRASLKLRVARLGNPLLSGLFNRLTTTRATWNGHNASGWTQDIVAVNGFDERMQYGGQDREMGERLVHAGIRPRQIRFSTIGLHLEHGRGYVTSETLLRNRAIRRDTQASGRIRTAWGIQKG